MPKLFFFCSVVHKVLKTTSKTIAWSIVCITLLFVTQSGFSAHSKFSNTASAKSATSPYKKAFSRSTRIGSKQSRRRSKGGSCIDWSANKINKKASQFKVYINNYSRKYRVDRNLIKAIITAESCFKVTAKSHKNAQGLMQLIPATAERFGVTDSYNPQQNIRGGTKYLRFLMTRFKGNLKKVIASYNAGEGAVDKYNGIPPYKETKQYVKNVLKVYQTLSPKSKKKTKPKSEIKQVVYKPPILGKKAGRQGWEYNRSIAPHLYKQR